MEQHFQVKLRLWYSEEKISIFYYYFSITFELYFQGIIPLRHLLMKKLCVVCLDRDLSSKKQVNDWALSITFTSLINCFYLKINHLQIILGNMYQLLSFYLLYICRIFNCKINSLLQHMFHFHVVICYLPSTYKL